jgi:surfactin synthase thioesterase subunit
MIRMVMHIMTRKPNTSQPEVKAITVRLLRDDYQRLKDYACVRDVSLNAVVTEAIAEYGRKIERGEVLRQLEDFHKELRASGRKGSDSVELLREMRKERTDAKTGPSIRSTGGGKP